MKITVLVNNTAREGLAAEKGLALWLENAGENWLFDTGAGEALLPNCRALGITPDFPRVVLSHGHSDHTGGLAAARPRTVFCVPGITAARFSRHADGRLHALGMPETAREALARAEARETAGLSAIAPGLWLAGPIPRTSGEDCGGDFFLDAGCARADAIADEQALVSDAGVLVTGCCHAGIINTMEFVRQALPTVKVHTLVGGLHLLHAGDERLMRTAEYLRAAGIRRLELLHCTGDGAADFLRAALPEVQVNTPAAGDVIVLEVDTAAGKGETAERYFRDGANCAQAVAAAFAAEMAMEPADAMRLVGGFGGGFGRMREVCGAVSGMVFVLSALHGARAAADHGAKAELYAEVQSVMKAFAAANGSYLCGELLGGRPRVDNPEPAARTEQYYRKRPCPRMVRDAAEMLARHLGTDRG